MRRHPPLLRLVALVACVWLTAGAAHADARSDPVAQTLARLAHGGPYTPAEIADWWRDWRAARSAVRRLGGSERRNLAGAVANIRSLAKRGRLGGSARPAFVTLRHNLAWFAEQHRATPANGTRRGFGSDLVWQLYAGSGWQLQPLGSFGRLNALLKGRRTEARIRALADQLLALGVSRRGYLAFEYLFPWGGGRPGWVSGMAQATGMQALAGAARRLGDERLMAAATRMRGAFEIPPPWGVRLGTGPGRAHFLLYSQAPDALVGNGFAQALLGLDRYRELSGDVHAARLVREGVAQARANLPRFDTGAWSLYHRTRHGPGRESDLHYHRLFTTFLGSMCDRFAEPVFCALHRRFAAYETSPVRIGALSARVRASRLSVTLRMSKRGSVKVSVWAGDRVVRIASRTLLRGRERFTFTRPRTRRPLRVKVEAVSLTGVRSQSDVAVRR